MTTSYKLDAIKALKAQKKLERAQEAIDLKKSQEEADKKNKANQERIAKKMARIEAGLPVEDPVEEKPAKQSKPEKKTTTKKPAAKKTPVKKPAAKRGRPKKTK